MMKSETASFGALVRRYRDQVGLTQEDLATRARLSYRSVSDIERGISRTPYPATVRRLADALGLIDRDRAEFLASARPTRQDRSAPPALDVSLPIETSALIGREREEAEAAHQLRFENVRLLTLTGPDGVGKTRLAQRLAQLLDRDFAEIHFISPAAFTDPEVLPAMTADAGVIEDRDGVAIEDMMVARLSRNRTLLVVDNLDHASPAPPLLGRLPARCPDLRIIATSRAPLRLPDEFELAVPPLALPDPENLPPLEELRGYPSIKLFCRQARTVQPEFQLTETNRAVVAAICIRLEGLPLALELAAARMCIMAPPELLKGLQSRMQARPEGSVATPTQPRTITATLAWSYELLTSAERSFLRRLAVLSGDVVPATLEQVLPGENVPELLTALVKTSWLQAIESDLGETHYVMLDTVQEFALKMLATDAEVPAVPG